MFKTHVVQTRPLTKALSLLRGTLPLTALLCTYCLPANSATIVVPNGNFTSAADNGSVGGGILATSGSSTIGSGPWSGTYNAVAGLLVPPVLTIADSPTGGSATIGSLLAVNVLGSLLDTSGFFSESIPSTPYAANTTYLLSADVDADNPLTALLLDNHGVGIALTTGSTVLASTTDGSHPLSISLLSGTDYQVQLSFSTGATPPSGNIGIRLFEVPTGLVSASLFPSVTFTDVTLDSSPAPEPGAFTLTGMGLLAAALALGRLRKKERNQSQQEISA